MGAIDMYTAAALIVLTVVMGAAGVWALTLPIRKRRKPAAIILITVAITGAIANAAPAVAAPTAPAPQFTSGDRSQDLSTLLLKPTEYAAITGAKNTRPRLILGPETRPDTSAANLDNPSCASVYAPADQSTYRRSGYRDLVFTVVSDGGENAMSQAVVRFPDLDHVSALAKNLKQQWDACAGQVLTYTRPGGESQRWHLGEPTITNNKVLVMPAHSDTGTLCQRAVGVLGALVIDVASCGRDGGLYAEDTVLAIAGKTTLRQT